MIESKLDGKSEDVLSDNILKLKEIFPEVFEDGKIDFEKLELLLGENVDTGDERYNFTWPGKTDAIRESQKQSTGTLRPCVEESKDWDSTQNLYIEGDNLEVLKLLQKSYYGKVKCIYIDPPYNTGKDFVYHDDYKDNLENYLELTGQVSKVEGERESNGIKLSTNVESDGRFHSNWLNMMYPRLKLARNLLKDDGVIFISIDDNEVDNLKKICNDIFGEQNFQSCVSWRRRSNQPNDDSKMIAKVKEYILVYSKSYEVLKKLKSFGKVPLSDKRLSTYTNPDNDPKGEWSTTPWCASRGQGGSKYEIVTPTGKSYNETWLGTKETFKNLLEEERIVFTNNGDGKPRKKVYKRDAIKKGQSAIDFWQGKMFGDNLSATADLKKIFKLNRVFDYSKPVNLLNIILRLSCPFIDGLVLDFFSGSATMAEAVLKYNSTMQKKLNYVMIQLDEKIPKSSEAYNAGYENICEIGKERIRRAGDMIVGESGNSDLDIGFKVFKLDSSNLEKWDPDFDNLEQTLLSFQDNVKSDRCDLDLVYEVMLKYGLDLTLPVEKIELSNNLVYSVGFNALLICLDDNVTSGIANEIVDLQKDSEVIRVVFKDNGFASDSDKTNIKETLKNNGIEEFITI